MLRHDQKGAALIEFAIVLPLLLLLVFGIIEFSLLMYNKAMITNASREGARRGIVYRVVYDAVNAKNVYTPLTDTQIKTEVTNYLSNYLITFSGTVTTATTIITPTTRASGDLLNVEVRYPYQFLAVPPIAALVAPGGTGIPGTITLTASTEMRME